MCSNPTLLSIVIPTYNEEKNVPTIVKKFNQICINNNNIEIIIVENGSTDNTRNVLNSLEKKITNNRLRFLYLDINKGYGGGIVEGLKISKGAYIGWTHADLQTDPLDLVHCLKVLSSSKKNNIFIKGFRKGRSKIERFFSYFMGVLESLIFNSSLKEVNAQPTVFPKSLIKDFSELPEDFMIDLYIFVKAKFHKLEINRFEVKFPKRKHGESSWNKSLKDVLSFSYNTYKKSIKIKKDEDYKT